MDLKIYWVKVNCSKYCGSWTSWGPTRVVFQNKKNRTFELLYTETYRVKWLSWLLLPSDDADMHSDALIQMYWYWWADADEMMLMLLMRRWWCIDDDDGVGGGCVGRVWCCRRCGWSRSGSSHGPSFSILLKLKCLCAGNPIGNTSCENVYEEGITYFGEQVSTSFLVWSTDGNPSI